MATKAKTVTVRVAVVYNEHGGYETAGGWQEGRPLSDRNLIREARDRGWQDDHLPHACIVDIELPIPKPLVGKVLKVKAVKP